MGKPKATSSASASSASASSQRGMETLAPSERAAVEATVEKHHDIVVMARRVTQLKPHKESFKKVGAGILVFGMNFAYMFSKDGKTVKPAHWMAMSEIKSGLEDVILIKFGEKHKIMVTTEKVDTLIKIIIVIVRTIMPFMQDNNAFKIDVVPASRWDSLVETKPGKLGDCGGFELTYRAQATFFGAGMVRSVVDGLKVWDQKKVTMFDLNEHEFGLATRDFDAVVTALGHNVYFKSFNSKRSLPNNSGQALEKLFRSNRALEHVVLNRCEQPAAAMGLICSGIASNTHCKIRTLDLSHNNIGDGGLEAIAQFVRRSENGLISVKLHEIGATNFEVLGSALHSNPANADSLEYLDIGKNKIVQLGSLAIALRYLKKLKEFRIAKIPTAAKISWEPVFRNLEEGNSVEILDLSANDFKGLNSSSPAYRDLLTFLKESSNLVELDVSGCRLHPDTFADICRSVGSRLLSLHAGGFAAPDDAIPNIVRALEYCTSLEELTLDFLMTAKAGKGRVHALDALRSYFRGEASRNLQSVSLKGDSGKGDKARSFIGPDLSRVLRGFEDCTSLEELDITGQAFGTQGAEALGRVIQLSSSLKVLRFDDNDISFAGFRTLGIAMQRNKSLVHMAIPLHDLTRSSSAGDKESMGKWVNLIQSRLAENASSQSTGSKQPARAASEGFSNLSASQLKAVGQAVEKAENARGIKQSTSFNSEVLQGRVEKLVGAAAVSKMLEYASAEAGRVLFDETMPRLEVIAAKPLSGSVRSKGSGDSVTSGVSSTLSRGGSSSSLTASPATGSKRIAKKDAASASLSRSHSSKMSPSGSGRSHSGLSKAKSQSTLEDTARSSSGPGEGTVKRAKAELKPASSPRSSIGGTPIQKAPSTSSMDFDEDTLRDLEELSLLAGNLSPTSKNTRSPSDSEDENEVTGSLDDLVRQANEIAGGRWQKDDDHEGLDLGLESGSASMIDRIRDIGGKATFYESGSDGDDDDGGSKSASNSDSDYAYVPPRPESPAPDFDDDVLPQGAALSQLAAISDDDEFSYDSSDDYV